MQPAGDVVIEPGQVYVTPLDRTITITKIDGVVVHGDTSWTGPQFYDVDEITELVKSGDWVLKT